MMDPSARRIMDEIVTSPEYQKLRAESETRKQECVGRARQISERARLGPEAPTDSELLDLIGDLFGS